MVDQVAVGVILVLVLVLRIEDEVAVGVNVDAARGVDPELVVGLMVMGRVNEYLDGLTVEDIVRVARVRDGSQPVHQRLFADDAEVEVRVIVHDT